VAGFRFARRLNPRSPTIPTKSKIMKTFKIALYPGDGIGVEVLPQAVRVLEAVQQKIGGFALEMTSFPWSVDYYLEHGHVVPDDYCEQLKPFDAILLGALGDPARLIDHVAIRPLLDLRQRFDQYAGVRPAKCFEGVDSPLSTTRPIDLLVIRENSEGEYVLCGGQLKAGTPDQVAVQSAVHTRRGIERILRYGFRQAQSRRKHLTMVTKSNALKYSMTLWDEVLEEIRGEFPDVEADKMHVDATAMNLVRRPFDFDVLVASNLFGDILSDLAGAIVGSLGLLSSANINPERVYPSMFEPVHGSAPDIVGQGIANPAGMILSAAMMLRFLEQSEAADAIEAALTRLFIQGDVTPDLGGKETTTSMTDKLLGILAD
jgi:tartrate dehydrogenase/decarboxylase/D-malate dehydrogenase